MEGVAAALMNHQYDEKYGHPVEFAVDDASVAAHDVDDGQQLYGHHVDGFVERWKPRIVVEHHVAWSQEEQMDKWLLQLLRHQRQHALRQLGLLPRQLGEVEGVVQVRPYQHLACRNDLDGS